MKKDKNLDTKKTHNRSFGEYCDKLLNTLVTVCITIIFVMVISSFISPPNTESPIREKSIVDSNKTTNEYTDYHSDTSDFADYQFPPNTIEETPDSYQESIGLTVYVTNTGEKYHNYDCQYLRQSCYSIELEDAQSEGYEPCSVCNPPW